MDDLVKYDTPLEITMFLKSVERLAFLCSRHKLIASLSTCRDHVSLAQLAGLAEVWLVTRLPRVRFLQDTLPQRCGKAIAFGFSFIFKHSF